MSQASLCVELVGIPFSTFTRTIRLGLEEKSVPYKLIFAPPHTNEANKHHPFELIPSLIFYNNDQKKVVIESMAIANFIDAAWPEASPLRPSRTSTDWNDIYLNTHIDELISMASNYLFATVEPGVVKTRLRLEKNQKDEEQIVADLVEPVQKLHQTLEKLEARSALKDEKPFLTGDRITWADYFCYPPLADLRVVNEGHCIRGSGAQFPRLSAWMDRMETLASVQKTEKDTLQDGWRPPSLRV